MMKSKRFLSQQVRLDQMGPRYTRRLHYQPIRTRNHHPYEPLMNSGEDLGDGLNKYPEQFFERNNARKNNYRENDDYSGYRTEDKYENFERSRSPYLSYDPYSNKAEDYDYDEPKPDFPEDSFLRRPDEDADDRQFFLPLPKPKQKPHFENPLQNLRPNRPSRPVSPPVRVTRQNTFGFSIPGLSRPTRQQFSSGPIDGDFRVIEALFF